MNKLNKTLIVILLVLCVGLVGLTIAYFSNSTSIENEFNTNPYGTTVTEEFVSPDNWIPGTTTPKTLTVTNSGLVDEAVRISYEESWTSKNSTEEGDLDLSQNNNRAAIINWTNTDDWTTVTEDEKIYKYYNYKLSPSSTTSELLESVTFNKDIVNSSNCVTTSSNGEETITCNSKGDGYDGATYKLTFRVETVQYDKYKEAWGTSINIASMKPMNARELALKSNPVSVTNYTDGNIHEMYTFNHEATEQTLALTDYRYIGNDPYNYVYFNCDSDINQNSETCEVWRIIGVFDVERPDPNDNSKTITEKRMKLIKGSALSTMMSWNSNGTNDWTNASLKIFFNEDYYNSLLSSAKNKIEISKYYLGSIIYDYSTTPVGSTEELYRSERGNILCDLCDNDNEKLYWLGNIGLMYPSDDYYIYDKGVNDNCFNNPGKCYQSASPTTHPETGWLYNTNNIENLSFQSHVWTISSAFIDSMPGCVFLIQNSGNISMDYLYSYAVRPVLYLSSSVKIIDGDGSSSNPYWLSN